jgi:hypothetical protein
MHGGSSNLDSNAASLQNVPVQLQNNLQKASLAAATFSERVYIHSY